MFSGVKVATVDSHGVDWIRETHKARILAYVDQGLQITTLVIRQPTFTVSCR